MPVARVRASLLAVAFVAGPALADFQVQEVRSDTKGKVLGERTVVLSESRMRIDDGDLGFVVDLSADKVLWLDHRAKLWTETPLEDNKARELMARDPETAGWAGRLGTLNALEAEMEGTGRLRYVTTNETRQIAGVVARKTDVFLGSRKLRERWSAESLPTDDVFSIAMKLIERDLAAGLTQDRYFLEFQATQHLGYPVLIRDFERGVVVEVKEFKRGPAAPAVFKVPAGYRKSD